jgi:hypothetical protein
LNQQNSVNHPPTVSAGADATYNYQDQFGGEDEISLCATGSDPDAHAVQYEWRDESGTKLAASSCLALPRSVPGKYVYKVTALDLRGGSASDSVTITFTPTKEIVLYGAINAEPFGSAWTKVADSSAAGEQRLYNPNAGAAKKTTASPNPPSYVTIPFAADPTQTYKLWIRLKADGNSSSNDSVWVQFSGSTTVAGAPAYRIGTTSGLEVNLEECSGCGLSGWGWEDDEWGAVNRNGTMLRFPEGGRQFIRIQQREDGVSIDQIVLSAEKYVTARPGLAKNDRTILALTYSEPD